MPVELEAWFRSRKDRSKWPSGPLGVTMQKGEPFRLTNPKQISFFTEVAKHNDWLEKLNDSQINQVIKTSGEAANIVSEDFHAKDTNIKKLSAEVVALRNGLKDKDVEYKEVTEELESYKDKYNQSAAEIEKLSATIKKLKQKGKGSNPESGGSEE